MFEEICLACGRLVDDGRAYCSDVCQNQDTTSPSISSASSPFSSPHLNYAVGGDVPALMPSALGSAFNGYRRDRYPLSSSSASSTSWSLVTDEEESDTLLNVDSDWHHDVPDPAYDNNSKSSGHLYPMLPSGLSYARRPSGTNNHSTVPLLHRRTSSGSSSGHVHVVPRSAPIHSHTSAAHLSAQDDEAYNSDIEFSRANLRLSEDRKSKDKGSTGTAKPKRTRNRASLPACFSLLQITGSSNPRSSPLSSSSGNTASHISPSTPKLSLAGLPHTYAHMQATPRGRRSDTELTKDDQKSRSPSPFSPQHEKAQHTQIKQSVEQAFDAPQAPAPRGRAPVRRNSSPPQKMIMNGFNVGSYSGSRTRTRGRVRIDEMIGLESSAVASGFGSGRSGLVSKERAAGAANRGAIGLS